MLYTYGMSKLQHLQFNMSSELAQRPIGSLNGYQLTWFYFGYSRVYACILGLTQVTGATLLLFRKTTLLAALIMLPVMVNILLINIFILRCVVSLAFLLLRFRPENHIQLAFLNFKTVSFSGFGSNRMQSGPAWEVHALFAKARLVPLPLRRLFADWFLSSSG